MVPGHSWWLTGSAFVVMVHIVSKVVLFHTLPILEAAVQTGNDPAGLGVTGSCLGIHSTAPNMVLVCAASVGTPLCEQAKAGTRPLEGHCGAGSGGMGCGVCHQSLPFP